MPINKNLIFLVAVILLALTFNFLAHRNQPVWAAKCGSCSVSECQAKGECWFLQDPQGGTCAVWHVESVNGVDTCVNKGYREPCGCGPGGATATPVPTPPPGGQICSQVGGSCTDDYPENCDSDGNGSLDGTRWCHKVGTCQGIGGGEQCSWGPGSYCGECVGQGTQVPTLPSASPTPAGPSCTSQQCIGATACFNIGACAPGSVNGDPYYCGASNGGARWYPPGDPNNQCGVTPTLSPSPTPSTITVQISGRVERVFDQVSESREPVSGANVNFSNARIAVSQSDGTYSAQFNVGGGVTALGLSASLRIGEVDWADSGSCSVSAANPICTIDFLLLPATTPTGTPTPTLTPAPGTGEVQVDLSVDMGPYAGCGDYIWISLLDRSAPFDNGNGSGRLSMGTREYTFQGVMPDSYTINAAIHKGLNQWVGVSSESEVGIFVINAGSKVTKTVTIRPVKWTEEWCAPPTPTLAPGTPTPLPTVTPTPTATPLPQPTVDPACQQTSQRPPGCECILGEGQCVLSYNNRNVYCTLDSICQYAVSCAGPQNLHENQLGVRDIATLNYSHNYVSSLSDECKLLDTSQVFQWYCDANHPDYIRFYTGTCPAGTICQNGACVATGATATPTSTIPITVPSLVSPSNNTRVYQDSPEVEHNWQVVAGASEYQIEVSAKCRQGDIMAQTIRQVVTNPRATVNYQARFSSCDSYDGWPVNVSWVVSARPTVGSGEWGPSSERWSFEIYPTRMRVPPAPIQVRPGNGTTLELAPLEDLPGLQFCVNFSWLEMNGVEEYELFVEDHCRFGGVNRNRYISSGYPGYQVCFNNCAPGNWAHTIGWEVKASFVRGSGNWGPVSEHWEFNVVPNGWGSQSVFEGRVVASEENPFLNFWDRILPLALAQVDQAVANANLTIMGGGQTYQTTTDANGYYGLAVPGGVEYILTITAGGYKTLSLTTTPAADKNYTANFTLEKGSSEEKGGTPEIGVSAGKINLKAGWNLVGLNVKPNETVTMQGLLAGVNDAGGIGLNISQWDPINNRWESYTYGIAGADLPLQPGQAVMVRSQNEWVYEVQGSEITQPIPLVLSPGLNTVSIPYPPNTYTAATTIDGINKVATGAADEVTRFESGLYESFIKRDSQAFGQDFPIASNRGYFIKVNQGVTWTP